jgi:hypothetical protein
VLRRVGWLGSGGPDCTLTRRHSEALSRASVRLLLGDPGLSCGQPGKPKGFVHGASVGVHACDSAHAWRNISRVCGPTNAIASLIAGAWHTGGQLSASSEAPAHKGKRAEVARIKAVELPLALRESVQERDQSRAAAIGERWLAAGLSAQQALAASIEGMTRATAPCTTRSSCARHVKGRHVAPLPSVPVGSLGLRASPRAVMASLHPDTKPPRNGCAARAVTPSRGLAATWSTQLGKAMVQGRAGPSKGRRLSVGVRIRHAFKWGSFPW